MYIETSLRLFTRKRALSAVRVYIETSRIRNLRKTKKLTQYIEDVSACKLTLENCMELWETCRSRYLQKKVHSQLYLSGVTQKAQKSCNNAEFLRKTSGNHFDSHTYLSLLKQTSNLNFRYCLMLFDFLFCSSAKLGTIWKGLWEELSGQATRAKWAPRARRGKSYSSSSVKDGKWPIAVKLRKKRF